MAVVHGPVGPRLEHPLRRPATALGGGDDAADGRRGTLRDARAELGRSGGRGAVGATRLIVPSRRDQIRLTADEQEELIETERIVVVSSLGSRGWPHSMPLWYVPREGEVWIWTYS